MMNLLVAISLTVLITNVISIVEGEKDSKSNAPDYDPETFKENLKLRPQFIKFYAPWCAHCRAMKPVWNDLYKYFVRNEAQLIDGKKVSIDVGIAKIDCSKHSKFCSEYEIPAYPTLMYFEDNKSKGLTYRGSRQLEEMSIFLQKELGLIQESPEEKFRRELRKGREPNIYTEENFEELVSTGHHFIKFYAPWCSFCQRMAPTWTKLAVEYHVMNKEISIAKVDCTKNGKLCETHGVKGYPTLLWFTDGALSDISYKGDRSYYSLKNFVDNMIKLPSQPEIAKENKFTLDDIQNKKDKTLGNYDPYATSQHAVTTLNNDNYFTKTEGKLAIVKFFIPGCGECNEMAADYEALAIKMRSFPVLIAEVNCDLSQAVCDVMQVEGYPTIVAQYPGGEKKHYSGKKNLESMSAFVMSLIRVEL